MTEEQVFLQNYDMSQYERPSVTTDVALFTIASKTPENYRKNPEQSLSILMIKRGGHPFKDTWALPGGFLQSDETVEDCARREITEETGITPATLMQLGVFSKPGRDPRGWIISNAFLSILNEHSVRAVGMDDAEDAKWFEVELKPFGNTTDQFILTLCHDDDDNPIVLSCVLRKTSAGFGKTNFESVVSDPIAFDHACIIASAITLLQSSTHNIDTLLDFLPEKFTLTYLQQIYQAITGEIIGQANFRRKYEKYLEPTNDTIVGAGHRPAKLYKKRS